MAQFPSLPLFTDAIVADCHHLTDNEFGLYVRILIEMWRSPGCRIPARAEWLEKKFRRSITEIGPILTEFCDCDGNYWTQGRLTDEYDWVKKNSKRQSVRSKARWKKGKITSRDDAALQTHDDAPHPTPPTPIPITETNVSVSPISPAIALSVEYDFEGTNQTPESLFDIFWHAYPETRTKGNRQEARIKFMELLKKGENHVKIIDGCRRYAAHCSAEREYNCNASTFLTRAKRRWEGQWEVRTGGETGGTGLDAIAEGFGNAVRKNGPV